MRIALDCRSAFKGMGGIGRYAWSLLHELLSVDSENEYVAYFTRLEPPGPLPDSTRLRIRAFEAGMIDERFDQLILPGVLAEDGVDLYHNPTFAVPIVRTQVRAVATLHDVVFRRHPDLVEARLRDYLDHATCRSCRHADGLVTVSEFSKREIVELYGVTPRRLRVIPNGVTVRQGPSLSTSRGSGIERYGLVPGSFFLYVGSIEQKKNLGVLIEAFAQVLSEESGLGLKLALAGNQASTDLPIEGLISRLGLREKVALLGHVSEEMLESLYREAAVFVYPSLYEGFGLPPLEAMARGVPTIVSDASSLPEVVGDAALLFDPRRPAELAKALVALLHDQDRRLDLSERGRRRAAEYSWRRSALEHLEFYKSVASLHENRASSL